MDEIERKIKAIDEEIEVEKHLLEVMRTYKDCEIKTIVINQCHGAIRGLSIGREYLTDIMDRQTNHPTIFDDHGIDYRGGMA